LERLESGADPEGGRIKADRAWVRLGSGCHLDLRPGTWIDEDLAIGLAPTYRWGGQSWCELPRSVTQHGLGLLAKGPKFRQVFLPGWDHGTFPNAIGDADEERSLRRTYHR